MLRIVRGTVVAWRVAMRCLIMTFFLGSTIACSEANPVPSVEPPPSDELMPPPDGAGIQYRMSATIDPGEEVTFCQYFAVPDVAGGPDVTRFEHRYSRGSHHLVVYVTPLHGPLREGIFECDDAEVPLSDLFATGIAYADQLPEGELTLPAGVGYHFDEGTQVLMQTHYLSTDDEPIEADVRFNMWLAEEPVTERAGTLLFSHQAIYLPAAPAAARADMHCELDQDLTLLFAFSHMHRRGTHFESFLQGAPLGAPLPLHATDDWDSPPPRRFDPPVHASAGQSIDFSCEYVNDRDEPTVTGASAVDNEMCVFSALYYPKASSELDFCMYPDSGPVFHGDKTCVEAWECQDALPPEDRVVGNPGSLACANTVCEAASAAFGNVTLCEEWTTCFGEFMSCLPGSCPEQWAACEAATCD